MMKFFVFMAIIASAIVGGETEYTTDDVVDLSVQLVTNRSMHWPGFPYGFTKKDMLRFRDEKGVWKEGYGFEMPVHTGTHMDAPCHFSEHGERQHEVPLERFFGPAAVMDCKAQVDENRDYQFSMQDLETWENENGPVPEGAYVLIHTGWYKKYGGDLEQFFGTKEMEQVDKISYPGVHRDVAKFLIENRNIDALGIDAGSPDYGKSLLSDEEYFKVHVTVLGNERILIENVGPALEKLPPTGYNIHALPLPLYDTCGAPVRLMAFKTPPEASDAPITHLTTAMILPLMFAVIHSVM